MLAIGVDHEAVDRVGGHAFAQAFEAVSVGRRGELRIDGRSAEVGQHHVGEAGGGSGRFRARTVGRHGTQGSIWSLPRSMVAN